MATIDTSVYYSLHNDSIFFCILNTFFVEALAFCYDFLHPDDIFTPFLVGTYGDSWRVVVKRG